MEKENLEKIKEMLLKEKERLEEELGRIAKKKGKTFTPVYPEYGSKDEENAAEVAEYEVHLALDKNLEKLLTEVIKSLAKIEQGTYGKCENCGKEINIERLEASPASNMCIDCQSKKDNKLVRFFAKFKKVTNVNKRPEKNKKK